MDSCCSRFTLITTLLFSTHLFSGGALGASLTDGPMVGGVDFRSAQIFVRTDATAEVAVEYGTSDNLADAISSAVYETRPNADMTQIITLDTLSVDTQYFYRVKVDGVVQTPAPYPSFTTFPHPSDDREFSFVVLADVGNYNKNPAPVYDTVARMRPAFMLQIGDWDHRDPDTLSKMRRMHREVRGRGSEAGRDFSRYIAPSIPVFHVWDDHDYGMNDGDYTFSQKSNAIKAYLEYYPTARDLPNPQAGIWQKLSYAQVDIFMLDVRSNRDPNSEPDDANKSMLNGENIRNDQKSWLLNSLRRSTATWKIITSGVPFNPSCKPSDSWGAFTTEWQEIVDFVQRNNISGVVMISGDLHSGGGIDDGSNSGLVELTVPHTNMRMDPDHSQYTTVTPGTWSEGLLGGAEAAGFGWIRVMTNPDRLSLEARGGEGDVRLSYDITL